MKMNRSTDNFKHTWSKPLLLAVITMFGLSAALLGTGGWRVISWIFLSVPLLVAAWHVLWQREAGKSKHTKRR